MQKPWQIANGCFRCGESPSYIKFQAPTFSTFDTFPRIDVPTKLGAAIRFFDSMIAYCSQVNKPASVNAQFAKLIVIIDDSCDTGLKCASFILSSNDTVRNVTYASSRNTIVAYNCIAAAKMIQIYQVLRYPLFVDSTESKAIVSVDSNTQNAVIVAFSLDSNSSFRYCQVKSVCSLHGIQEKVHVPDINKEFQTVQFLPIQTPFAFVSVVAANPSIVTSTETLLHLERDASTVCRKKQPTQSSTCYNSTKDLGGDMLISDALRTLLSFDIYNLTSQSYFGNYTSPSHIISRLDKAMNLYIEKQNFVLHEFSSQSSKDHSISCPSTGNCWMGGDFYQGFDTDKIFDNAVAMDQPATNCIQFIYYRACNLSDGDTPTYLFKYKTCTLTIAGICAQKNYVHVYSQFCLHAFQPQCYENISAIPLVPTDTAGNPYLFDNSTIYGSIDRVTWIVPDSTLYNMTFAQELSTLTNIYCGVSNKSTPSLLDTAHKPLDLMMPNNMNSQIYYTHGIPFADSNLPNCSAESVMRNQYPYNLKYPIMYIPIIYAYSLMTQSRQLKQLATTLDLFLCDDQDTGDVWLNDLVSMTLDCNGMGDLHDEEIETTLPFCQSTDGEHYVSTSKFGLLCEYATSFLARSFDYPCQDANIISIFNSSITNQTMDQMQVWLDSQVLQAKYPYEQLKFFNQYNSSEMLRVCKMFSQVDENNRTLGLNQSSVNSLFSQLSHILNGEFLYLGLPDAKCSSLTRCIKYPNPLNNRSYFRPDQSFSDDSTNLFGDQTILNRFRKTMVMLYDRMFEMNEVNMTYDLLVAALFQNDTRSTFSLFPPPNSVASDIDSNFALSDSGCLAKTPDNVASSMVNMDLLRETDDVKFTVVTREGDSVVKTASLTFIEDLPN
jgi:hypothetical protein